MNPLFYIAVLTGALALVSLVSLFTRRSDAPLSSGEAVVPVLSSSSANTLPAGPSWTFSQSWRTRLTAAGRVLHALRGRARDCRDAIVRTLREEFQFSIDARRRGYVKGLLCAVCHDAIHHGDEMCPKQWAGQCVICGPVLLDYYGHGIEKHCDPRRGHTISRRHKATHAEWVRARFRVLKPTPIHRKPAAGG